MKRIFLKNLGILLIGSISFAACKKAAPGESGGPAPSSKRLIKSEVDAANYSAYEYNADGLLSKVTEIEEGQTVSVLTFAIANKKVTEASYNSGEKLRFVYNGENIDTMKIYSGVGVYAGFVKYKYEGGRNIQQSFFFSDGEIFHELQRLKFAYSANGNVENRTVDVFDFQSKQWSEAGKTVSTRFDNKRNPLSLPGLSVLTKISGVVELNNVEEQKVYEAGNTLVETRTNSYVYDSDGYPTSVKETSVTSQGSSSVTTKFIYNN